MKKMITKHLCLYMAVAMFITCLFIFTMQTYLNQKDNTQSSYDKLQIIEDKLESNDAEIQKLKNSLSENAIAKTRAFAYMIANDPALVENSGEMEKIRKLLMADELHVIDENGFITYTTVPDFVGFDMRSGEQTKVLLPILDDPTMEVAQDPQPNATKGILFQYVSVARLDKKGIVQIGIRPEVLEDMLEGTSVDVVLASYDFGVNGYIFAVDKATGNLLAHKNQSLIGTPAVDAGFPADLAAGQGKAVVDGVKGYYVTKDYNNMLIGTMLPADEYYKVRLSQTAVVSSSMFVIFVVLIIMINRLVNKKIVKGIRRISEDMQILSEGNLDLVISESGNPEFEILSNSINKMVRGIQDNLSENAELLERQKEDMEKNRGLIRDVKQVCKNIEQVTQVTLDNSKAIHGGTQEQKSEVERMNITMSQLTKQLKESADTSKQISANTNESVGKMLIAKTNMESLMRSIQEIADTSMKIVSIIDEIESIASQTNMLSLNASIEAARAGEMGKGFAVVATQVGELAERSAKAAKETTGLIMNTINVVDKGKNIAGTVVDDFLHVVDDMEMEKDNMVKIAEMAEMQVKAVMDALNGLGKIAEVVENNVVISRDGENTSENLASETDKLYGIVGVTN